jgi:hypothetical protein
MKAARLRLALVVVLFLSWIAWLTYLALPTVTPRDVLSHAQFLTSQLDVIARVDADAEGHPSATVHVEEVHWPDKVKDLAGKPLNVINLRQAKGFTGSGVYILPLVRTDDAYRVAPVPRSPGFDGSTSRIPHIYVANEQNRKQLAAIPKPAAP